LKLNMKPMIKISSHSMGFQRAADGASAVFPIMMNGLMRATRKTFV